MAHHTDALLTDLAHALTKLQRITNFTLQQIQETIAEIASSPRTNDSNTIVTLLKIHHELRETQHQYCDVADHIMRNHIVVRIREPARLAPDG